MKKIIEIRKGIKSFIKKDKETFVNLNDLIYVILNRINKDPKIKKEETFFKAEEWENYFQSIKNDQPKKIINSNNEHYINVDWLKWFLIKNNFKRIDEKIFTFFTNEKFVEKLKDLIEKKIIEKNNEKK